ncbi:unnamed protein product [Staurois parvus]|uniref:Transposase n=1 Tax=Staurois parvus TaxID=386267 RepID=A0ABN9H5A4_9NEOB|nr:unnamed protein product [Staurois parvus]
MRTGHPAVKPSAHTTEAGKTAWRWIEEQVRSQCRADTNQRTTPRKTAVISCTVRSLWSSPVLSAVSGHLLYCVRSLWSSPVLCPQSLVISCTVSAVKHLYRANFFGK